MVNITKSADYLPNCADRHIVQYLGALVSRGKSDQLLHRAPRSGDKHEDVVPPVESRATARQADHETGGCQLNTGSFDNARSRAHDFCELLT